jgi:hypothetical protein
MSPKLRRAPERQRQSGTPLAAFDFDAAASGVTPRRLEPPEALQRRASERAAVSFWQQLGRLRIRHSLAVGPVRLNHQETDDDIALVLPS